IYGLTKVTFFESVRSSDELLTFWKFWGALFFILGVFVNGLNAPSPEAIENKWKKLRRRFSNEKNHPGRFFQLASRTFEAIKNFQALILFLLLLPGVFFTLRWLLRKYLAQYYEGGSAVIPGSRSVLTFLSEFLATPQGLILTAGLLLLGYFIIRRKRIATALDAFFTETNLRIEPTGESTVQHPDLATPSPVQIRLQQSEIRLNLSIFDFASSIPYLPARPLL